MEVTVFIDTNAFLQMHDLATRPWRDVLGGVDRVTLMVAAVVIEELDKHKSGSNQRRRDRARLALRTIEEASRQPTLSLVLKAEPVEVCLRISTVKPDWSSLDALDRTNPDDRLVAEAACTPTARLLSHDTAPRIRGRIAGVPVVDIPDAWLLQEEKSEDRKEIARLTSEIARLTAARPILNLRVDREACIPSGAGIARTVIPLRAGDKLASIYAARHPVPAPPRQFPPGAFDFGLLRERSIEEHRRSTEEYAAKVRQYFAALHNRLNRYGREFSIPYTVENVSTISVSSLRIQLNVLGANLLPKPTDTAKTFRPPRPAPPSSPADLMRGLINPRSLVSSALDDPVSFRWIDRPDGEEHSGVLHCSDFRAAQVWNDTVDVLVLPEDLPTTITVTIEVTGTNLPAPLREAVDIPVSEQRVGWDDEWVQEVLPPDVRPLVFP